MNLIKCFLTDSYILLLHLLIFQPIFKFELNSLKFLFVVSTTSARSICQRPQNCASRWTRTVGCRSIGSWSV